MPDFSFQNDAIERVSRCYANDPNAKQLLVIPTGGGKTLTALRAVNKMLVDGVIPEGGMVYWVQHLIQLKNQSQRVLDESVSQGKFLGFLEPCHAALRATVKVKMLDAASREFPLERPALVIIDEAHHSAAASYGAFFQSSNGVLGLTATPKRLDDNELKFDDIVYSITARELITRGVIVKPEIRPVKTNTLIDAYDLDTDISQFDSQARNRFVAEYIMEGRASYTKGILFVRTRDHAIRLTHMLEEYNKRYELNSRYEHIGYVLGGDENSSGISNDAYLERFKNTGRALVVNCGVLTEGFDDPTVNTVFMVVPTKSVVLYLQCIGRAIRSSEDGLDEKAFIVEFEDDMPNVRYRIDNRWLFADISDELEPEVMEVNFSSVANLKTSFSDLEEEFNVDLWSDSYADLTLEELEDISILLYNSTDTLRPESWKCIAMSAENRRAYSRIFNVLSAKAAEYADTNVNYVFDTRHKFEDPDGYLSAEHDRTDFFQSCLKAADEKERGAVVQRLKYILLAKSEFIPDGLKLFLQDCYNRGEILSSLDQMRNEGLQTLLKVPLLLSGFEAVFITEGAARFVREYLDQLSEIEQKGNWKNWTVDVLNQNNILTTVPISPRHFSSLPSIVRLGVEEFLFELNDSCD